VASVLKTLREEEDPFIVRLSEAHGLQADTYELVIPDALEDLRTLRWRSGIIRAVHPMFRVLGGAAYLVWETLASAGSSEVTSFDISANTGVPVRTVQEALVELGELGLCERRGTGWLAVGDPDEAGEMLGADLVHADVVAGHRRDRAQWRGRILRVVGDTGLDIDVPPPLSPPGDAPDAIDDASWLLRTHLSAVPA